jgi:hypothetical protein
MHTFTRMQTQTIIPATHLRTTTPHPPSRMTTPVAPSPFFNKASPLLSISPESKRPAPR